MRSFGERGRVLVRALRQARVEIWQVASRALFQPQLQELDWLIWDWRRRNPAVTEIAAVRFDEASAVRGRALADAVRSGGGLLAPISDAVTQIDESRELAERAFFLAKRLPMLIDWQVQGTLDDVLLRPEVATAMANHADMVQSIGKLTAIAAEIPAVAQRERQAALDAIGGQVQSVRGLVDEVRKAIADVTKIFADVTPLTASGERIVVDLRETSTALTQTITAVDALLAKVSGGPPVPGAAPSKPFDIAEYAAVVGDLAKMVKDLNALVGASNNLLGSNVLSVRLKEVDFAAAERVEHASVRVERVVAMVFVRLALLLVLGFVLLIAYRWLAPRLVPKRGGA